MNKKICKQCGKEKYLSEFGKAKTCKDGHRGKCKECENEYKKQWHKLDKEFKKSGMPKKFDKYRIHEGFKICRKCGVEKPLDEFSKVKKCKDGHRGTCKECSKPSRDKYRKSAHGKKKEEEYRKQYVASGKAKEALDRYRNSEKGKLTKANYLQSEHYKKVKEEYNKSEAGKRREQIKRHNRNARKNCLPNTLTGEEWNEILLTFDNKCALTGKKHRVSLEHYLPLSILHGGTYLGNVYPMEKNLNSSKSNKNPLKWIQTQPEKIKENFYRKVLPVLAYQNDMTVDMFKKYTNWCFANARTIEQTLKDNEKGLTSKDLFYNFLENEGVTK